MNRFNTKPDWAFRKRDDFVEPPKIRNTVWRVNSIQIQEIQYPRCVYQIAAWGQRKTTQKCSRKILSEAFGVTSLFTWFSPWNLPFWVVPKFQTHGPYRAVALKFGSFFELRIESLNVLTMTVTEKWRDWTSGVWEWMGGPRFCYWIRPASMVVLVFSAKIRVSWDANLIVGWPEPFTSSIWRQRFVVPMVHLGLLWITLIFIYFHICSSFSHLLAK